MTTAALVLAAGSSRRLGQPKQLLPYRGRTLLDASLDVARSATVDHCFVTVGGAAPEVLESVDFSGFDVVESVHHTNGCSSSIVSALAGFGDDISGFVLLLGDQPELQPSTIDDAVAAGASGNPIVVTRYSNGIGHPFWFGREIFADLAGLHGDKAVWKLIESGSYPIFEIDCEGDIPLDVDTWDEYEQLLTSIGES